MAEEIGNAYLTVRAKQDDASFDAAGKSGGSAFGGAFAVAAGNLLADLARSLASALGETLSTAFNNYADFEQLAGGVEKIFDQADTSKIFADANNAYKELNMSANEYLASINQTGAAFAQTMGDAKGYEVARKGMIAIADYASGTGRDIDELNEKFALITRSTASYQSIADQFAGILPATSADFLAQAQAAGLLSTEYKKLTEVPMDEYQEAVAAMLVLGVDNMGLLGNTAKESTETLSGSLAMLKSSWNNFLTGIFDDNADLGQLGENLFASIEAVASNVVPRIGILVSNVFTQLPAVIGEAMQGLSDAINPALDSVLGEGMGAKVTGAFQGIMDFIGGTVIPFVSGIAEQVIPVVEEIAGYIADAMPAIETIISTAMGAIQGVFDTVWPIVSSIVVDAVGTISTVIQGLADLVGVVQSAFTAIKTAIENPMETAKNLVKNAIDAIKGFFNFKISWPHVPLPHFTISPPGWSIGDLLKGSIPSLSVNWYARGGIVDGATLIGAGEQGPEAIVPLTAPNIKPFADAVADAIGGRGGIYIENMTVRANDADEFVESMNRQLAVLGAM